jgi:hypothetical protein
VAGKVLMATISAPPSRSAHDQLDEVGIGG